MEVVPETFKIVFDAVVISDVPGTSGTNVKPPNVLLASAELGNVVAVASGNVASMAFDDDIVRRVDDENATVVRGDSTGNAAWLACWEAACPAACAPCACARRFDGSWALRRGTLIGLLDKWFAWIQL